MLFWKEEAAYAGMAMGEFLLPSTRSASPQEPVSASWFICNTSSVMGNGEAVASSSTTLYPFESQSYLFIEFQS